MARRIPELTADNFDPTPLLLLPSTVIQYNKTQSRVRNASLPDSMILKCSFEGTIWVSRNRVAGHTHPIPRQHKDLDPYAPSDGHIPPENSGVLGCFGCSIPVQCHCPSGFRNPGRWITNESSRTTTYVDVNSRGLPHRSCRFDFDIEDFSQAITPAESTHPSPIPIESIRGLADNGFYFLQHHTWSDIQSDNDYTVSIAVAKLVLEAADHDPDILMRHMSDHSGEVLLDLFLEIVTFS
jgi:hypothetical protein